MKNFAFGILGLLLLSSMVHAGLAVTDYSVSQDSFRPGSRGLITLYISNPSSCPTLPTGCEGNSRLTGVSISVSPPAIISMDKDANIGDLELGSSTFLSLPFSVADDAQSGIYRLDFRIYSFGETGNIRYVTIPVTIANTPEFVFTPDSNVLTSVDSISLRIENNGGLAKNVKIKISEDTAGVALYGTNQIYIGDLSGEKTVAVMLDSRSAQDGPVNIPFLVTYEDEIGVSHEETDYVRMTVKKEMLDLTFTQDSDIITRKDSTLVLSIRNNGNEPLNDVKITLTDPNVRLRDKNELNFGSIAAGGQATVSGGVFASLSPGLNLVPAKVTWTERDVNKEQDMTIPLTISSDADVGVYIETKPAPLTVGTEHTLSILVSNLGSYAIDNVDVEIDSDILESLDISNKQYIGSLAKDDFSTVQFKTKVISTAAPGDYTINVKVRYRDQSGEWETKTIYQPITVYSAPSGNGGNTILLIVVLAVIALVAWYFFFRK
ncbi:hypothetical protein H0O02_02640, partial [Candidatus Micrarchaeota archaeon]|nr:hypothetical protein [Candidatus Micrarchaeota archaeon]